MPVEVQSDAPAAEIRRLVINLLKGLDLFTLEQVSRPQVTQPAKGKK
jgi:hypothetical protein